MPQSECMHHTELGIPTHVQSHGEPMALVFSASSCIAGPMCIRRQHPFGASPGWASRRHSPTSSVCTAECEDKETPPPVRPPLLSQTDREATRLRAADVMILTASEPAVRAIGSKAAPVPRGLLRHRLEFAGVLRIQDRCVCGQEALRVLVE